MAKAQHVKIYPLKHFLTGLAIFCAAGTSAQTDPSLTYAGMVNASRMEQHLRIIAGEEMEGRETGTEGQRKAAAYIEAQFRSAGLQAPASLNGYQQHYPLYRDTMISATVQIGETQLQYGTDYFVPVLNNGTRRASAKSMVFAGYGIDEKNYSDYKGLRVKGRVVVLFSGEPKQEGIYLVSGTKSTSKYSFPGISEKVKLAQEKGAAAVIVINPQMAALSSRTVQLNTKSNVYYPGRYTEQSIGYIAVSHEAVKRSMPGFNWDSLISRAVKNEPFHPAALKQVPAAYRFDYQKERLTIMASNVLGVVEGTDKKEEYVFITAHYDHLGKHDGKIYYGADDDGSGTCAVIAMGEAFAKAKADGKGPRRTVVLMTVSGEEKGLWGSEYYSEHPVFPLDKTTVDLNIDMIGRIDTERKKDDTMHYVYVIGHDKLSSDLQPISEGMNRKYTGLVLDYKFDDPNDPERIYYRSDHYNFARKGVPILFFYDGMLKADYHKPTDTVEKITWPLYEKRAQMIFHTAWEMANRDAMLVRDIPLPEGTER